MTLGLVIFIFQKLPNIQAQKKSFTKSAEDYLAQEYDDLLEIINNSKLSDHEKVDVFNYFKNEFDFDQPDGTFPKKIKMNEGDYRFALGKSRDRGLKRYGGTSA